jgi:hypothetical protein
VQKQYQGAVSYWQTKGHRPHRVLRSQF